MTKELYYIILLVILVIVFVIALVWEINEGIKTCEKLDKLQKMLNVFDYKYKEKLQDIDLKKDLENHYITEEEYDLMKEFLE